MDEQTGRRCVQRPTSMNALGLRLHSPLANVLTAGRRCRCIPNITAGTVRVNVLLRVISALPNVTDLLNEHGSPLLNRKCAKHPMSNHALRLLLHTPMANVLDAGRCCRPVIFGGGRRTGYYLGAFGVMSALPNVSDLRNLTIDALNVRAW